MIKHYILEDGKPKDVPLLEWGKWMEANSRRVEFTKIGKVEISTVFLGLDHGFGHGKVILFESMIFGGKYNGCSNRYETVEQAKKGHATAVKKVKQGGAE